MKLLLVRSLSWGWGVLVALVIVSAIVVSVARIATPFAKEYRGEVAAQLSRLLKRPVAIDEIALGWHGFAPTLELFGVQIKDDMGLAPLLGFHHLEVRIDPWRSLRQRQLEPDLIALTGSELSITRTRDGRMLVRGLQHLQRGPATAVNPLELLAGLEVRLRDIQVQWQDAPLGRDFAFTVTDAELKVQPRALSFEADVRLPSHLGNAAHVVLMADGPVENYLAWNTRFFLDGDDLELAGWPLHWLPGIPGVRGGRFDVRLWGERSPEHGFDTLGDFSLRDFSVGPAGDIDQRRVIPQVTSRVAFRGGAARWRLDLDQLWIVSAGRAWPASGLSLGYTADADRAEVELALDWADVGTLAEIAQLAERLPFEWQTHLAAMQLGGELSRLRLALRREGAEQPWHSRYSGMLSHLRWLPSAAIPGISGLQVSFGKEEVGQARFSGIDAVVTLPRLLEQPVALKSLFAELSWHPAATGWTLQADRVRIEHADFRADGAAVLRGSEDDDVPTLTAELQVPAIELTKLSQHLPYRWLPQRSGVWLREAFRGGTLSNAHLRWDGPLAAAAFTSGKARLSAGFQVSDGVLRYLHEWPEIDAIDGSVRFDNASLNVVLDRGRLFSSALGASTVAIPDLSQAVIAIDARARGPVADVVKFLRETPIGTPLRGFLESVAVAGDSALELGLRIPARFGETEHPSVRGRLELLGSRLRLDPGDIDATEVTGLLEFTEQTYHARGIRAILRDRPVTIDVETGPDRRVGIDVAGRFALKALLPTQAERLEALSFGDSDWRARIEIPRNATPTLTLTSDLHGTGLRLPEPLGKATFNQRAFKLQFPLQSGPINYALEYADLLSSRGSVRWRDTLDLQRVAIGLGRPAPEPPASGVLVQGRWGEVKLSEWLGWLGGPDRAGRGGGVTVPMPVNASDVRFDTVRLGSQRFRSVQVTARGTLDNWNLSVQSPEIAGDFELPARWRDGLPLRGHLKRLIWQRHAEAAPGTGGDGVLLPHQIPALDLTIDDLRWGDSQYERGVLRTAHTAEGQSIERLELHSQLLSASVTGFWRAPTVDRHQTFLELAFDGRNVGAILREVIGTESLGSGVGHLNGWLRWPGPPHVPVLTALEGRLETTLRNGRLLGVEPGLGRLIALLSIDHLPKRLALNFRDVAEEGFAYDVLGGAASFRDGYGTIEDLTISGSAARMALSGLIGLAAQSFDGTVVVRPRLSGTLPVAASFLAGPEVGVVVYLFDKLMRESGIELGAGAELTYAISGDWGNPVIRLLPSVPDAAD
ncbi:MAG: YhdP family protein [Thiotrichales bacterium]